MPGDTPHSRHGRRARASWHRLKTFAIAAVGSPPPPTRPGKAELRARVVLQALNEGGDTVQLEGEELKALLTLVNYDDGATLPDWSIEYDSPLSDGTQQSIDFWIATSKPCGPTVRAGVSILPPGESVPIQTRPASGHGFDSYVDLSSVVMNPLWYITTFVLSRESSSDRVYVNGLQQIKLKVELAFTDLATGKPGVPTPEELESLTIAMGDDGVPLPLDPDFSSGTSSEEMADEPLWWVTSPGDPSAGSITYDKGYDPYPGVSRAAEGYLRNAETAPRASVFRYFQIACRRSPAQKVQLCAFVACRDGWTYRTNGVDTDPCGGTHAGKDSQIEVLGLMPEIAALDRFPWVRDVLSGDDDGVEASEKVFNPDSVHRYSLSYIDPSNKVIGIRSVEVEPAGMIQWHDKVAGEARACFTGYASPGSTTIQWSPVIPVGATPLPSLPSTDARKAVVVLVGRQDIPFQSGKPNGPCILKTTDWYGNSNTLQVRFDSQWGDGRWKLVLYR